MEKDFFKYYKPGVLIILVIVIFVAVFLAKDYYGLSISIFGIVTLIISLTTKYLWKYKPFSWLFWIDDFSGRYEGVLQFQYQGKNGEIKKGKLNHVKIITQSGSQINISSFTKNPDGTLSSPSINKGMFVEPTQDGQHYNLIYNYLNNGSTEQGFPPHYGTEVIKFIKNGNNKKLSGYYFTNRTPFQTKGEFKDLNWVNNNKKHEF